MQSRPETTDNKVQDSVDFCFCFSLATWGLGTRWETGHLVPTADDSLVGWGRVVPVTDLVAAFLVTLGPWVSYMEEVLDFEQTCHLVTSAAPDTKSLPSGVKMQAWATSSLPCQ